MILNDASPVLGAVREATARASKEGRPYANGRDLLLALEERERGLAAATIPEPCDSCHGGGECVDCCGYGTLPDNTMCGECGGTGECPDCGGTGEAS